MIKNLMTVAASILAATATSAAPLFDNGPVVDAGGLSVVAPGNTTFGWSVNANSGFVLADNFSVSGPDWRVGSFDVFAYQTGATSFTFTSANWQIIAGADINTGTVVSSGSTTVTNGGLVGYRVQSSDTAAVNRPIFRIGVDIPDVTLSTGNYVLAWSLAGSLGSGPFGVPVLNSGGVGNALRSIGQGFGSFSALQDSGSNQPYDLPFVINSPSVSAIPEPQAWALMILGFGSTGAALRLSRRTNLRAVRA